MNPWARRAVIASALSLLGIVPHAVDDVLWNAGGGLGLSPSATAWFFGLLGVITVWATVRGASGTRSGMRAVLIVGAGWALVAAVDHWQAFVPGEFRVSFSSRVWVWWIVGSQGLAALLARRAMRELPEDGSERGLGAAFPATALVLVLLVPGAALVVENLTQCVESRAQGNPDDSVSEADPDPANRCPPRGGSFQGRVTTADGDPVVMAFIDITGGAGPIPGIGVHTDREGRYEFPVGLQPGNYTVRIGKGDYRSPEKEFRIDAGQITIVDFLLENFPE